MTERLPDQEGRDAIVRELARNLLVEAGAGSGKTTALLGRMVALVESGHARIEQVAAVTFTRKAASELRERFQTELEGRLAAARDGGDGEAIARLDTALHDIDRGFVGTIHSFCARLLRERPLDVGIDPDFREIYGPEELRSGREAWLRHLERLAIRGDESLARLRRVNLTPALLQPAYERICEHPDVVFPAEAVEPPRPGALRAELERLLEKGARLLPVEEPEDGWDDLMVAIRQLRFLRWSNGWRDDADFFDALALVAGRSLNQTQKRWADDPAGKERAKRLRADFLEFGQEGSEAWRALMQWYAYRYPIALDFVRRAAEAWRAERLRTSRLNFNDLLMLAARLLRQQPSARRDLAERYPFLLVDEFQDTDPIQAEVLLLLSADAAGGGRPEADEPDWRVAAPRPGSLFVVGDPKQSIYRFRRADIAIYNQVKQGLEGRGEVVGLTANFRSRPPIAAFVNAVFAEHLPAAATQHQAAFASLDVQQPDGEQQGVFWYEVPTDSRWADAVTRADAEALATWIAGRVGRGERRPEDFLVLTYRKFALDAYARELERRDVPVQVTGGGISVATELAELRLLLRALADPDDPVLTVAALTGLFFGLDHEQLAAHRLEGGRLGFVAPIEAPASAIERALARLHEWWNWTRWRPIDVAVSAIVDEVGLLPHAAAGELGETNAGAVLYALHAIRAATAGGDASLQAALDVLDDALAEEEAEAPLQPGRGDVVRVMNLHKAKGLQGKVVVLAHPTSRPDHTPDLWVERPADGDPVGHLLIQHRREGEWGWTTLARPLDWPEHEARERPFAEAELVRLLYVAATRAEEELVIAHCDGTVKHSPWGLYYPFLKAHAERLELVPRPAAARRRLEIGAGEIAAEIETIAGKRAAAARPRYRVQAVTTAVRGDDGSAFLGGAGRGAGWGTAVHQALEAAGQGVEAEAFRTLCRGLLIDNEQPTDEQGEPVDLDELLALVEAVRASDTWGRSQRADQVLYEVPFAVSLSAPGEAVPEPEEIVEGVIDLVFREADGWVVADYKTDVVEDAGVLERRRVLYRDQVDVYASCWQGLTGEPVKERRILWLGMRLDDDIW